MKTILRVGTRRSALAMTQTNWVIDRLQEAHPSLEVEIVPIETEGDLDRTTPLPEMGGRGVFVTQVERALIAGEVDFAVHSFKDLPTSEAEGTRVVSVPMRADPRDALVSRAGWDVDALPESAVIGTGSLRRQAQLAAYRRDLRFVPVRGNVDTRRRRALEGACDATVLALAGLVRLGFDESARPIPTRIMLPAAAQGALALQCRSDDEATARVLKSVDDGDSHAAAAAERRLLALLRGGCHAPVGTYCRRQDREWVFEACVAHPDGTDCVRADARGEDPSELADRLYERLCAHPTVLDLLNSLRR